MKGKRTNLGAASCGVARALQIIGDWWSLLIVRDAFQGRERFGEFQKNLGLAKNILSSRLKKLVEEGIFRIDPDPESALSRRYVLTPKGEQLYLILVALWQWGEENCFECGELELEMVDKLSGQPVTKLQLTAHDGRVLGPRDYRLARKQTTAASLPARTKGRRQRSHSA
jgi:DNA-binding HxlR family transcriptional regulator